MKRISLLLLAFAMVLGMSQCKKNNEMISNNAVADGVTISLKVAGDNDGSKVIVTPNGNLATVEYANGDRIIVASNGKYAGTLTRINEVFIGTIKNANYGDKLYFYFLGNKESGLTVGASTCTVNIANQTAVSQSSGQLSRLPVISAGVSEEIYTANTSTYNCNLYNKVGLVKLSVSKAADVADAVQTPIKVKYTTATIDFSKDPNNDEILTYGDEGIIELPAVPSGTTADRYAIMFPQYNYESAVSTYDYGELSVTQETPIIVDNSCVYYDNKYSVNITKPNSKR